MSDTFLSLIDGELESHNPIRKNATLLLICQLINLAKTPSYIEKLKEITLKHLNEFLVDKRNLYIQILRLASLECANTLNFIYKVHQHIIKLLLKQQAHIEISQKFTDNSVYKKAKWTLILFQNYRDSVLNHALNYLGIETWKIEQHLQTDTSLNQSQLIQGGNSRACELLEDDLHTTLIEQRVNNFLIEAGLENLTFIPSESSESILDTDIFRLL